MFSDTQKLNQYEITSQNLITLKEVIDALKEKGYNVETQIVGYFLTGDPTYITAHNRARIKIQELPRFEILQYLVSQGLKNINS